MKKIEELKMAPVSNGTPDEYLCPITREIMKDPVIAAGECLRGCLPADFVLSWKIFLFPTCRRLLVWEGGHWELDQHEEPHQPNDQPTPADHTSDTQPHAQNGHFTMDHLSVISDNNEPRTEVSLELDHHGTDLRSDWLQTLARFSF